MVADKGAERIGVSARLTPERSTAALPWLTVEVALYVLIGMVAAGLRFYALGAQPLRESEATQALAAWRFSQGNLEGTAGYSPLLFLGNVFAFVLLGASNALARLVPALFGTALAVLPYFLRPRLGRRGALVASILLALSPSTLFFSRYLGGPIVVTACVLAVLVGFFGYLDSRQPKYAYLIAAALALSLSADPMIYTFVLIFGTFLLLLALIDRLANVDMGWSAVLAAWQTAREETDLLKKSALVVVAVVALVSTAFLLNFAGLPAALDFLPTWLAQLGPQPGDQPWYYYFQLLVLYEPLILILGLIGLVYHYIGRRDLLTTFLLYWTVAAAVIYALAGQKAPGNVLLLVLPLALLASLLIGRFWDQLAQAAAWGAEGLFVAFSLPVVVFLAIQLAGYASSGQTVYLYLALVAFLVLPTLIALCWMWLGQGPALRYGEIILLLVLAMLTVNLSVGLNYHRAADPREPMVAEATSPGVVDLVTTLERISSHQEGDPYTIATTVEEATGPVLAWHLRNFRNTSFVEQLSPSIETPVVVTLAREEEPTLGGSYVGQSFASQATWNPLGLTRTERVRWLLYREAPTPVESRDVVLWVKQQEQIANNE
ncbi:MAG: flippase activity-associated protein Agl23 [Anaerolineae bacterium]